MLKVNDISYRIGYYLAGFADSEGSFKVSFRKKKDEKKLWKILLYFRIAQGDKVILALFKRHLKCGTLRNRKDIWYYEVQNLNAIQENVIPFFEKYSFLSAQKKHDFACFKKLVSFLENKEDLTEEGIKQILKIRAEIRNGDVGRKHSDAEILKRMNLGKSSETTCQADTKQSVSFRD